uniref:Ovule protein n=1 Tax=Macrostomum lignano TaxID=282301 RepID=A0A1I8FDX9_9PLAT
MVKIKRLSSRPVHPPSLFSDRLFLPDLFQNDTPQLPGNKTKTIRRRKDRKQSTPACCQFQISFFAGQMKATFKTVDMDLKSSWQNFS